MLPLLLPSSAVSHLWRDNKTKQKIPACCSFSLPFHPPWLFLAWVPGLTPYSRIDLPSILTFTVHSKPYTLLLYSHPDLPPFLSHPWAPTLPNAVECDAKKGLRSETWIWILPPGYMPLCDILGSSQPVSLLENGGNRTPHLFATIRTFTKFREPVFFLKKQSHSAENLTWINTRLLEFPLIPLDVKMNMLWCRNICLLTESALDPTRGFL